MIIDADKVAELFLAGFNCAESMLLVGSEAAGIDCECFPRIASCLGAGLSFTGDVCGIANGALMLIGLQCGRMKPEDTNEKAYYFGAKFLTEFKQIKGTHHCREITGLDFNWEEDLAKWETEILEEKLCVPLIRESVRILNIIISEIERFEE